MKIRKILTVFIVFLLTACSSTSSVDPSPEMQRSTEAPTATENLQITPTRVMTDTPIPPTETATQAPTETATIQPTLPSTTGPVQAIILFIGDGMGEKQRLAANYLAYGMEGSLVMNAMPVQGSQETSAVDREVTDSAAAGTAMATGYKTNYRVLGMDADYNAVPTILEQAKAKGWAVGLVTTVQMAHATPASFAAHTEHRDNTHTIALQMAELGIDVLIGGGEDDFIPSSETGCHHELGHRWDARNLIAEAVAEGYSYVCTADEFFALDASRTDKLIALMDDNELSIPYSPTLAEMTQMAIDILSKDPDGFFLMVEGGQIDWEGHDNSALDTMQLTVGLDAAVTTAQVYALGQENTLIVVTADHETGGMSVGFEEPSSFRVDGPFNMPDGTEFWVDWSTGSHTGVNVPVSAQGPWSELLYGEYSNTWIYQVMLAALRGELP